MNSSESGMARALNTKVSVEHQLARAQALDLARWLQVAAERVADPNTPRRTRDVLAQVVSVAVKHVRDAGRHEVPTTRIQFALILLDLVSRKRPEDIDIELHAQNLADEAIQAFVYACPWMLPVLAPLRETQPTELLDFSDGKRPDLDPNAPPIVEWDFDPERDDPERHSIVVAITEMIRSKKEEKWVPLAKMLRKLRLSITADRLRKDVQHYKSRIKRMSLPRGKKEAPRNPERSCVPKLHHATPRRERRNTGPTRVEAKPARGSKGRGLSGG